MAQTLIPEVPSPCYLSKAVAASFVHLPSKLGKRVIKYVQMDLLTRPVPSCLHCVNSSPILSWWGSKYSCQGSDFSSCLMSLGMRNLTSRHSLTFSGTSAVSLGRSVFHLGARFSKSTEPQILGMGSINSPSGSLGVRWVGPLLLPLLGS